MFTGIIQDIGTVEAVRQKGDTTFVISTSMDVSDVQIGASIACDGVCLTVVEKTGNSFSVEASQETLSKTSLSEWAEGTKINLERALRMGDELGGHMVSGHVDGLATIESIAPEGDSHRFTFSVPEALAAFIAPKGSVTLDGISLTVNEVEGNTFGVNIIPHTFENTTLGTKKPGDTVNAEIDMLARYVARMMERAA